MPHKTFDGSGDEARAGLLDNRTGRKAGKNHGTGKRNAAVRRKKKRQREYRDAQREKAKDKFMAEARAYWRGERPDHP